MEPEWRQEIAIFFNNDVSGSTITFTESRVQRKVFLLSSYRCAIDAFKELESTPVTDV